MEKTFTWDAEVFAVGTWNGIPFSATDLKAMAASYNQLHGEGVLDAPLKFGHNDDQPMTDGEPALGWIEELYVADGKDGQPKLFAKFVDVPETVYTAVQAKRYRKVSIELDFGVTHKGRYFDFVLTGIALLGADLPAVNTLADLTEYMSRPLPNVMRATRHAQFSAVAHEGSIKPKSQEGRKMAEIDDKELERLQAAAKRAESLEQLAKEHEDKLAKFQREQAEREEAERKTKVANARDAVTAKFETAVKEMRITPAQRDRFAKLLKVDDDEAVVNIDLADVDELIGDAPPAQFDRARGGETGDPVDDAGDALSRKAHEIRAKDPKLSFSRALELAMRADPELAKQHVNATYTPEG